MSQNDPLNEAIQSLQKHSETARKELAHLNARRADLQEERAALLKQGVSREDYAEVVLMDIDRVADQCQIRMRERFAERACVGDRFTSTNWPATLGSVLPVVENTERNRAKKHPFAEPLQAGMGALLTLSDGLPMEVAIYLFRDQIKAATRAAIMSIQNWPMRHALSLAQMRERLTEIDTETADIDTRAKEIRTALARVGGNTD